MKSESELNMEDIVSFEKARYEYCLILFQRESSRRDSLDRKSQFLFSFVVALYILLLFNVDFLAKLSGELATSRFPTQLTITTYLILILLSISLILSLISILSSMNVRSYADGYPEPFSFQLFSPKSDYFEEQTEAEVYKTSAMTFAIAVEINDKINAKKGWWINLAATSLYFSIFPLIALIAVWWILLTL